MIQEQSKWKKNIETEQHFLNLTCQEMQLQHSQLVVMELTRCLPSHRLTMMSSPVIICLGVKDLENEVKLWTTWSSGYTCQDAWSLAALIAPDDKWVNVRLLRDISHTAVHRRSACKWEGESVRAQWCCPNKFSIHFDRTERNSLDWHEFNFT